MNPAVRTLWSGAVLATVPLCGALLLDAAVVRQLVHPPGSHKPPRTGTSLVPLTRALDATPMHLDVALDGCELDIGELEALQVGDVLTLRHRVDAPAVLSQAQGRPLFAGWLARTRGRRAVELAPYDAGTRGDQP